MGRLSKAQLLIVGYRFTLPISHKRANSTYHFYIAEGHMAQWLEWIREKFRLNAWFGKSQRRNFLKSFILIYLFSEGQIFVLISNQIKI